MEKLLAALRTGRYAGTADARPAGSSRVNVPLAQREPTDGSLVRRAGHGEGHVAGAVWCAAFSDRLPYRQVTREVREWFLKLRWSIFDHYEKSRKLHVYTGLESVLPMLPVSVIK